MRYHRGSLYKRFPQLWKRMATLEEKRKMQEMACPSSFLNTNIMLVKACEVWLISQLYMKGTAVLLLSKYVNFLFSK